MDAVTADAPLRHPWLDRLIAAPGVEVRALAEGTASIHPYRRAEPSDAAATLLFGLGADDPAIKAFDQGTLETLAQYRAATGRADRDQRSRIALAALDLMTVVQRLAPRDTVIDLHRRFPYWNAWAETLVLDRGLDLRREYWRALALTQDVAAEAGLASRRLLPFWLDICGEAGRRGRYDESYLTVGLLGLRSLPLGEEEAANEEAALHGLARWADAQRPAKKRFLREWHVLEGAFPRDPTFWTDLVTRVIASVEEEIARQTNNARKTFNAAEWWREDVEAVPDARPEPRAAELEPPPRELREALLADISAGRPFSTLEPRLNALMQRHERYATRTGDTFYLVRTACNVGMRLLRGGDAPERRAAKARELAQLALRFEGAHVYAWALWRDALAAEGHLEAAELVGWERIRRFPEDPQARTQLALLLTDRLGRPQEAKVLLRETMELFSDNAATRNQLALLLAEKLEKPQEADKLLRETIRVFPDDHKNGVIAHTQLANIVGRESARLKEAITLLDAALKIEPNNQIALSMKRRFETGKTSVSPRAAPQSPPAVSVGDAVGLPADLAASALMRRALFRFRTATENSRQDAKREVEAILIEDENLAYARYVAAATGIIKPTTDDSVPAAAYLAVAKEGTAKALQRLDTQLQGLDGIVISLAGASRGDEVAATRLKAWMAEPANDLSPRDHGLRVIAAHLAAPLPADFVGDMLAASLGTAIAA
jgi:tetratricopeptide (TPR) repeat protein